MKVLFLILSGIICINGFLAAQVTEDIQPAAKFQKQEGPILSLAFQPDGKILISGSEDKTLLFRSFPDGKEIKSIGGFSFGPRYCSYTSDSKYLIVAFDKNIRILTPVGELVNQFVGTATHIWSFTFNQVTNKIALGSYDKNLRSIDFISGKSTLISGHLKNSLAVEFSPDNKLLASGSLDETVKLWDAQDYKLIQTFTGHGGNIYDVAFTPDSKKLLTASADKSVRVWDLTSGKWEKSLLGSESPILCMALSPDGYYLACGCGDGTIKLWDILRNECIFTTYEHAGQINTLAFSPDGKYLVSGGVDKQILVWEMKPEFFVYKYFNGAIKSEIEKSGLFLPKNKDENKDSFKIRQDKANQYKKELLNRFYQQYLSEIKGKPVI